MNLPVRLLSIADADLAQHAEYLQQSSTQLAIRFLESFDATVVRLAHSSCWLAAEIIEPALFGTAMLFD